MKHILVFALCISGAFLSISSAAAPLSHCPQCGLLPFPNDLLYIEEEWTSTHQSLSGSWDNSSDAPDILVAEGICALRDQALDARLTYSFQPNGRFEKVLEAPNLGASLAKTGRWRISPDQKYILLDYQGVDAPYMEVVAIRHIDGDELVLDIALSFQKANANTPSKELFFNKL